MEEIARAFRAQGNPQHAASQKAYLKSQWAFHGVNVPCMRAEAKAFRKRHPDIDIRPLVDEAWRSDYHDLRTVSIELLVLYRKTLTAADVPWLESILRQCPNWDHVDHLCTKVLGPMLSDGLLERRTVNCWAKDDTFWVRRAALLVQLPALSKGGGDFAWFSRLAVPMLQEKEFFIRKVIGWVLREVSKKRPALVSEFLEKHLSDVSGVTFREAVKYLPDHDRLRARWRPHPG
ncbi:MAG TPA: DNA alkylation repair protein [Candidatus Xenobia bacterium]